MGSQPPCGQAKLTRPVVRFAAVSPGRRVYELGNGQWNIPALRELLENVLPQDKVFNDCEVRHDFENLGSRTMLLNARQIDHLQLILLAMEDITERKRAEEALRELNQTLETRVETRTRALQESEARLRALTNASSQVLYRMNPDWSEMRQLQGGNLIADTEQPNRNWLHEYIHPDDQPWVLEVIHKAIRTGTVFDMEHRVRRIDGTLGWMASRAVPMRNAAGEIVEWFGAASDITARKQAEEMQRELNQTLEARVEARTQALWESEAKYRTLFNSIDEGFCIIEVLFDETGQAYDYCFLEANPAFEQQTGLVDAIGKTVRELVPQHDAHWFEIYGQVALTGQAVRFEDQAVALGRFYDVYAFRVGAPAERRVAVLFADIKERKQAEEQLKDLLHQKEILLKEVNHRVKNNLQAINNLLYLQASTTREEPMRQMLQAAQDRIKAIALVHEQLFRGGNVARLNLAHYLAGVAQQLRYSYRVDPDSIVLKMTGDETEVDVETAVPLGIIVNELVSNALKHAFPPDRNRPAGQPDELEIELRLVGDGQLLLTVRDNGVGLPAGLDLKEVPSLGLRLVAMLTDHMRGELEVERNGGTAVKIKYTPLGQQHFQAGHRV